MPKTKYKTFTLTLTFPEGFHPVVTQRDKPGEDIGDRHMVATKDAVVIEIVPDEPDAKETA